MELCCEAADISLLPSEVQSPSPALCSLPWERDEDVAAVWSHFFPRLGEALALIWLLSYHPFVPPGYLALTFWIEKD